MSIYKGSQELSELYLGGVKIGKVYKGSTLLYESANDAVLTYNVVKFDENYASVECNEIYYPSYSKSSSIYYLSIPNSNEVYANCKVNWMSSSTFDSNSLRTSYLVAFSIKSFSENNVVCITNFSEENSVTWTLNYSENVTIQNIVFRKYKGADAVSNGEHEILLPEGFVLGKSLYLSNSGVSIKAITTNGYTRSDDTSALSDGIFVGKDLKIKVLSGKTV